MSTRNELRDEARRNVMSTLLTSAVLRWESFVTILVTAILFLFVRDINIVGIDWQPWFWLVLGGLAEAALVVSTITDPDEAQEVMAREFEARYEIGQIKNQIARGHLKTALEYRRNMLNLVKRQQGALRTSLRQTVEDINEWIGHMYELARHIDGFESNEIVERDLKTVPQKIEKVQQRIRIEKDERVRADLEEQLKNLERQKANLDQTVNSVKRAEIQLETTLASLGTIYAQMSLMGAKEVDSAKAQRLRLQIREEVNSLEDTLSAMDEVQNQTMRLHSS
jgi:hypothetical protein